MADMKDFLAKLNEDKAFADEIAAVQSMEELLAKAKAAGFDVTEDELAIWAGAQPNGELTDDELDAVSGGGPFSRFHRSFNPPNRLLGARSLQSLNFAFDYLTTNPDTARLSKAC